MLDVHIYIYRERIPGAKMMVRNLTPGDRITLGDTSAVFVGLVDPHPLYAGLVLVIWWIDRDSVDPGRWSHDALSPNQDVGNPEMHPLGLMDQYRIENLVQVLRP